jgi:hypothetical protein
MELTFVSLLELGLRGEVRHDETRDGRRVITSIKRDRRGQKKFNRSS